MKGLLIEFDLKTGNRAGEINPKDRKLPCQGQNLVSYPALEIRLVKDDRDLSKLEGIKGVTILENKAAINKAIDDYIPSLYTIQSEYLMCEDMKERNVPISIFTGMRMDAIAKEAFQRGLVGVIERKPEKVR